MIGVIRIYQKYISPIKPPSCRFYPTCSNYAVKAIKGYGLFAGFILSAWRVMRCNPLNKGGIDPVPEKFLFFKKREEE